MGSDLISANITDEDVTLTAEEAEALTSYSSIGSVAPTVTVDATVKKGTETGRYSVLGVTPDYFTVMDEDIQRGRLILDSDDE